MSGKVAGEKAFLLFRAWADKLRTEDDALHHWSTELSPVDHGEWRRRVREYDALCAALAATPSPWQPIEEARKDRTPYLMAFKNPVPHYDERYRGWDGRFVVCRHEGIMPSGYDMGWSVAAPVGFEGIPDAWISACMPIAPLGPETKTVPLPTECPTAKKAE